MAGFFRQNPAESDQLFCVVMGDLKSSGNKLNISKAMDNLSQPAYRLDVEELVS